jgi:hypothetical protein
MKTASFPPNTAPCWPRPVVGRGGPGPAARPGIARDRPGYQSAAVWSWAGPRGSFAAFGSCWVWVKSGRSGEWAGERGRQARTMTTWVYFFGDGPSEVTSAGKALLGGKGLNLGIMTQLGKLAVAGWTRLGGGPGPPRGVGTRAGAGLGRG